MRNILFALCVLLVACKPNEPKKLTAQEIIDKCILASGADKVSKSIITFDFRNKKYKGYRKKGRYQLMSHSNVNDNVVDDILANDGYTRYERGKVVEVPDSMITRYSNSVNSVHYFSVLPFGLNDKAVNKKVLESISIKGRAYHKIQVTFNEEGGGEDFDDVFIYWIDKESFLIDYLAYSFHVNGGGVRFRELKEQCVKEGIRFVDYNNYKAVNANVELNDLDKAYENNELKKVSEIVLKDIKVTIL